MLAPDRTHAPPPMARASLLDRPWTAHDYEPRTSFPRAISPSVRRAALAVAVTVACERCDTARAALPYRRVAR